MGVGSILTLALFTPGMISIGKAVGKVGGNVIDVARAGTKRKKDMILGPNTYTVVPDMAPIEKSRCYSWQHCVPCPFRGCYVMMHVNMNYRPNTSFNTQ